MVVWEAPCTSPKLTLVLPGPEYANVAWLIAETLYYLYKDPRISNLAFKPKSLSLTIWLEIPGSCTVL